MPSIEELRILQALPLSLKVRRSQQRIREWVSHYGVEGVYISFSGGKDSTVLLHLVRELYPCIPAVFVNTGLEYPEIQRFARSFENVVTLSTSSADSTARDLSSIRRRLRTMCRRGRGMIKAIPLSRKDAIAYVGANHRHHAAAKADKFRVGAEVNGELVGVVQVGRPVSRNLDDGYTLEVLRLCTNGERDVCSFLYGRAARIAREMGYSKIVTYILESESGASLLAAGWHLEASGVGGGTWDTPSRPRALMEEDRQKYPTEKKQRWGRQL